MIPVLLIVTVPVFPMLCLVPGDPAVVIAGDTATDEQAAAPERDWDIARGAPRAR